MIEVTKDTLIHYCPYRINGNKVAQNETVKDVLDYIHQILWKYLNDSEQTSKIDVDLELKLVDLQAEVSQWQKKLKDMQEDPSKQLKKRFKERKKAFQKVAKEYLDKDKRKMYPLANCSPNLADDPETFEEAYQEVEQEYADVDSEEERILNEFQDKMERISKVKFRNIDPFTKQDIRQVPGELKTVIRMLIDDDKENEDSEE